MKNLDQGFFAHHRAPDPLFAVAAKAQIRNAQRLPGFLVAKFDAQARCHVVLVQWEKHVENWQHR